MCTSFLAGKDCDAFVCLSSLIYLAGNPMGPPILYVYPDRRTDIWSPHEPQAPKGHTHTHTKHQTSGFLRGVLQMCAPPQNISALQPYSIYHTHCLVLHPHILVSPPNIFPIPPRPPTLCSLGRPLTWLRTNESLCPLVVLNLVFMDFSPPHGLTVIEEFPRPLFFLCHKHFTQNPASLLFITHRNPTLRH